MVRKQYFKHSREYPQKKWTESEIVAILTYMQNNRNNDKFHQKLTARDYYSNLLNETKINATWNLVKCKVRRLKLSFEKAEDLRNSIGCGYDIDSQKEIQEQIHKLCPHYKQLSDIFSDAKKSSTAGQESQVYYFDESLLSCVKQELHVDDNTISEFVEEEPQIEDTVTSAFVTQEPCPVITSNDLTDQSLLEKNMAYDRCDHLGTHFPTKTKQSVEATFVTQEPCPVITLDNLTEQSLFGKTMANDRCDPLPTKTKQPVVATFVTQEPCPVITSDNLTEQSLLEKTMANDRFNPLGTHFSSKTKQPVEAAFVTQEPCPVITSDDLTEQSLLEKTMAHDRCDPLGTYFPTKTKQPVVEALLAKLSAIDTEKTKYEECMLSLEMEKFHWNKQIEKRKLKLKKKRMKMEFQMRQMEMEQEERLFKLELQMKYNNQNSIYK